MTFLIAHRGLLNGPDPEKENLPSTIERSRSLGYDVEIDLWLENGEWYLGHDKPSYLVSLDWLKNQDQSSYLDRSHLWIHAKNIEALHGLRKIRWEGHTFYHQSDDVVLTNTGWLWTYPGKTLTDLSICVMPEWIGAIAIADRLEVAGFCTDHVREIETKISWRK